MKLIQFTASKVWRGHEQKIIYLYEAFKTNDAVEDQWIICPLESEIYTIAKEKGLQVIPFDFKSEYSLSYAKKFKHLALEKNASVILIHNSKAHTIAVLSAFIFGLKTPLVLCRTLIKRVDTNFFRKWKYNYKGIKKILCVSQAVIESLKPAVKDHSRFKIIGSVTDVNKFPKQAPNGFLHEELQIPKDYQLIGNIAEFTAFKDHFTWIDTVRILVNENKVKAKYILVGKGKMEQEIRDYVAEKQLTDHIIFLGFRRDIPKILPEFNLFLFTSKNEPTGGVLLESYACKVPIVAANAGGIPEVIVNNETGLLAEAGNPRDFANKVEQLLNDESLQNKFVENGYAHLKANFIKKVISQKFYEALNEAEKKSK